jgi:hypothetical protein
VVPFETILRKDGAMSSFVQYYKRFLGYWGKELWNFGSEQMVGIVLAVLVLIFQIKEGLIPSKDAKITAFATVLWPYLGLISIYLIIHWIRTPWKLDEELLGECKSLEVRLGESNSQLEEIENTKPRIMLCDPGAIHTQFISFSHPGMQPHFAATFVKARFINVPHKPFTDKSVAERIMAKLRFFDSSSSCVFVMDGRWDDTDQPSSRTPTQSKSDLLSVSFGIEGAHNVDIAFWDAMTKTFVAFNNDSYYFQNLTKPEHVLGGGPIRAEIRLVGPWVEEVFSVNFWIGNDGKVHVA